MHGLPSASWSRLNWAVECVGSSAIAIIPCFSLIRVRRLEPKTLGTASSMFAHPEGMFHRPGVGSSNPPALRFRVGMAPSVRVVSVMQINASCGPGRFVGAVPNADDVAAAIGVALSPGSSRRHAAVDVQRCAGDVARVVGGQEADGIGDLDGLADATQNDALHHRLLGRVGIRVPVDAVLNQTSADVAGSTPPLTRIPWGP